MGDLDNSPTIKITGTIMVIAIIVLFLVVVLVLFLHLYARRFWRQIDEPPPPPPYATRRRRRRPPGVSSGQEIRSRTGLDTAILKRLPVVMVQYNKDSKQQGLECAVCLSEIEEGEKGRLLPKCNHWFHVDCIDMWFKSHSTCPLCRSKVVGSSSDDDDDHGEEESLEVSGGGQSLEEVLASSGHSLESAASFPTNVLVWGDETQVSTNGGAGGEGNPGNLPLPCRSGSFRASSSTSLEVVRRRDEILVIDIPDQIGEDLAEEDESDKSPVPRRLRSFRRMLSRERRVAPSGPSSSDEV